MSPQKLLTELGVTQPERDAAAGQVPACVIVGTSTVSLFGLTGEERLRRSLRRAGAASVCSSGHDLAGLCGSVVLLRADFVFEEVLIADLLAQPGVALFAEGEQAPAALHVKADQAVEAARALEQGDAPAPLGLSAHTPASLSGEYNKQLRKRSAPYLRRASPERRRELEKVLFDGSYKGVTDLVTKFVWPEAVKQVTRVLARLGFTPNMVTSVSLVLTLLTVWLFWHGQYAAGLLSGWGMAFLDSVDGKLARVTLSSTRFGNVFDHAIDLIHPPFWYWAWMHGLGREFGASAEAQLALSVIVGGYVAQRLLEAYFIGAFKIEMHIWRRFDSYFRTVTARRNPNMLILTLAALFGAPAQGILAVALWTGLSLGVHLLQIFQARIALRRGMPIHSWLTR